VSERAKLQRDHHVAEPGHSEAFAQPRLAKGIVGKLARKAHGATGHHAHRGGIDPGGGGERAQELRHQVGQGKAAAEDACLHEAVLCQIGLHRHDQPAVEWIVEIGGDRSRAGGVMQSVPCPPLLGPEAQHRAEQLVGTDDGAARDTIGAKQRDDAVGGAEINTNLEHGFPQRQRARFNANRGRQASSFGDG